MPAPLLDPRGIVQLQAALERYTVDAVAELLGPLGTAAAWRSDLAGVARAVLDASGDRVADLVTLVPARRRGAGFRRR